MACARQGARLGSWQALVLAAAAGLLAVADAAREMGRPPHAALRGSAYAEIATEVPRPVLVGAHVAAGTPAGATTHAGPVAEVAPSAAPSPAARHNQAKGDEDFLPPGLLDLCRCQGEDGAWGDPERDTEAARARATALAVHAAAVHGYSFRGDDPMAGMVRRGMRWMRDRWKARRATAERVARGADVASSAVDRPLQDVAIEASMWNQLLGMTGSALVRLQAAHVLAELQARLPEADPRDVRTTLWLLRAYVGAVAPADFEQQHGLTQRDDALHGVLDASAFQHLARWNAPLSAQAGALERAAQGLALLAFEPQDLVHDAIDAWLRAEIAIDARVPCDAGPDAGVARASAGVVVHYASHSLKLAWAALHGNTVATEVTTFAARHAVDPASAEAIAPPRAADVADLALHAAIEASWGCTYSRPVPARLR